MLYGLWGRAARVTHAGWLYQGTQSSPPGWIDHVVTEAQRDCATCSYAKESEF
jgi:hypothetical protein